jgi:hypothetical protein
MTLGSLDWLLATVVMVSNTHVRAVIKLHLSIRIARTSFLVFTKGKNNSLYPN